MAEFPALPFWTDAYLADTRHLSTLEHGAYFLLLMEAWRRPNCTLPDDEMMLARLAGVDQKTWASIRPVIMSFWKRDGRSKTWSQKRLSLEKDYVRKKSKSQKDKIAKRWDKTKKDDTTVIPEEYPGDTPTPTPTPTVVREDIPNGISRDLAANPIGEIVPRQGALMHVGDHVDEAFAAYQATRREFLPNGRPLQLGSDRRKKLAARLNEIGPDNWREVLMAIRASPFLRGETSRDGKFVAEIDWLLEPKNLRKVMEGNYDGRPANAPGKQSLVRGSPIDALNIAITASGLGRL